MRGAARPATNFGRSGRGCAWRWAERNRARRRARQRGPSGPETCIWHYSGETWRRRMTTPPTPRPGLPKILVLLLGAYALVGGLLTLLGWFSGSRFLTDWH